MSAAFGFLTIGSSGLISDDDWVVAVFWSSSVFKASACKCIASSLEFVTIGSLMLTGMAITNYLLN
ncbi:hypothetical protein HanIR_Chr01g0000431 [Helianthus annuus]|nr:hypothetical protein HanIR_Chr01g0000431 [Helianthus annuus]